MTPTCKYGYVEKKYLLKDLYGCSIDGWRAYGTDGATVGKQKEVGEGRHVIQWKCEISIH